MNDLADENHRLLASYHTSQQEMVHLRGHLATLYTSLRSVTQGIETSLQEVEMTATTTLTRLLAVFLVLFVLVCGLWLSIENPHPTGSGGTLNFYQSFFFLSASLIIFLTIIALRKVHKYPQKYNQQYMRTMQVLGEVQGLLAKEAELGDLPGGLEDIEDYEDDSDEDEEGATNSGSARVPPAGVGAALGDITRGRSDSDSTCSSTHSHTPVAGAHHHTSILAQLPGPTPPILVVRSSSMVPAWLSDAEKAKMLQPLAIAPHAVWDIDNELFSGRIYMLFDGIQGADREFFRYLLTHPPPHALMPWSQGEEAQVPIHRARSLQALPQLCGHLHRAGVRQQASAHTSALAHLCDHCDHAWHANEHIMWHAVHDVSSDCQRAECLHQSAGQ